MKIHPHHLDLDDPDEDPIYLSFKDKTPTWSYLIVYIIVNNIFLHKYCYRRIYINDYSRTTNYNRNNF